VSWKVEDGTRRPQLEPMRAWKRRQLLQTLLLIFALGLALTAVALLLSRSSPSTGVRVVSAIVGALAGALVGASVSNVVNSQYDRPVLEEILGLLVRTSTSTVTSSELSLRHLRKVWHFYHLTVIEGRRSWRYVTVPFDNHSAVGSLTADVPVVDVIDDGPPHVYKTDAAVWDRRLILLQTRVEGDEAAAVSLFPNVSGFQKVHAGVAIMQSWDGEDVLVPTLISSSPLLDDQQEGSVTDEGSAEELASVWTSQFGRVQTLLPSLNSEDWIPSTARDGSARDLLPGRRPL
jgi:hypothetical protein